MCAKTSSIKELGLQSAIAFLSNSEKVPRSQPVNVQLAIANFPSENKRAPFHIGWICQRLQWLQPTFISTVASQIWKAAADGAKNADCLTCRNRYAIIFSSTILYGRTHCCAHSQTQTHTICPCSVHRAGLQTLDQVRTLTVVAMHLVL